MKAERIWMAYKPGKPIRFTATIFGWLIGVHLFAPLFFLFALLLFLSMELSTEFLMASVLFASAVYMFGMYHFVLRYRILYSTVFFQTGDGRLFAVNLSEAYVLEPPAGGFFSRQRKIEEDLREIAETHRIPPQAGEILRVRQLTRKLNGPFLICDVRLSDMDCAAMRGYPFPDRMADRALWEALDRLKGSTPEI